MEVVENPTPVAVRSAPGAEPGLSPHLRQRIETQFRQRWEQDWKRRFVTHGVTPGPDAVRLDGNDYLSVTGRPEIVQAQLDALRCNREFVVQSGVFQLDGSPTSRFEAALAAFVGKEGALLCQSGYTANLGLIQVIADPQTPVYVDSLAHMSLWEGVRAAGAPPSTAPPAPCARWRRWWKWRSGTVA
jgi:CAI-1 autoinducer synthase